jgi:3-methyladenine DNA glycosylase/8-oxoguanine DNA glycosylase
VPARACIERAIVRRAGLAHAGLLPSPTRDDLGRLSAAQVAASGLAPRRASALVRVSHTLDLERLAAVPSEAAASRLLREPQLGPWTVATVFLHGLGRYDRGLVGDLGLIKLCSALLGRRAEAEDTADLLAPYGEWAGLASLHLLRAPRVERQERAPRARIASA